MWRRTIMTGWIIYQTFFEQFAFFVWEDLTSLKIIKCWTELFTSALLFELFIVGCIVCTTILSSFNWVLCEFERCGKMLSVKVNSRGLLLGHFFSSLNHSNDKIDYHFLHHKNWSYAINESFHLDSIDLIYCHFLFDKKTTMQKWRHDGRSFGCWCGRIIFFNGDIHFKQFLKLPSQCCSVLFWCWSEVWWHLTIFLTRFSFHLCH